MRKIAGQRKWQIVGVTLLAVLAFAVAGYALIRPDAPTASTPAATRSATPTAKVITVAAVGDSITEGNSQDFNNGRLGTLSWPSALPDGKQFVGGWAKKSATTQVMLDNVKPVAADVLVVIAGTNDLGKVEFETSAANIGAIVAKVGAKRAIISAIPPYDPSPEKAVSYNIQLVAFAKAQGWTFVDAMAGVRNGDRYAPGMTGDGVHPTQAAVDLISKELNKAIVP